MRYYHVNGGRNDLTLINIQLSCDFPQIAAGGTNQCRKVTVVVVVHFTISHSNNPSTHGPPGRPTFHDKPTATTVPPSAALNLLADMPAEDGNGPTQQDNVTNCFGAKVNASKQECG